VEAAGPGSCMGMGTAIHRRLRAGTAWPVLTGRPAIYHPVPRQAVRKRRPSPNPLRCGVTRPSRVPRRLPRRRGPRRTGLRRRGVHRTGRRLTALRRTALIRPVPRPTAARRTKPPNRRARLPAGCRAGPLGSLAGDRAHRPAVPLAPARHRHQPPRRPGSRPSLSPYARRRSSRVLRSRRVGESPQARRAPVSDPRRSPTVKRLGQGPGAERRSLSLPARLPSRGPPPGQPDRTGRLVLVRRTPSRPGARPSRSGARWCPRS